MNLLAIMIVTLPIVVLSQEAATDLVSESWWKGSLKVHEASFDVAVECREGKRNFTAEVQLQGESKPLVLRVAPAEKKEVACSEEGLLGWQVDLSLRNDKRNILQPTLDPYQDYFTAKDFPGLFGALSAEGPTEGLAGLYQKRVIKAQGFFVVLKATDVQFASSGLLTGLRLSVSFSNAPQ